MAGETIITVVGNLTNDPELRFTPSGAAVANFTIASTPKVFDRQANEFKDGDTLFLRCAVWREAAENVAESLTKGMRVVAQGRLKPNNYETKEGEKRTAMELEVEEVGPSLRWASAKVTRAQRSNGGGQQQGQHFGGQQHGQQFGGGQQGFGQQGFGQQSQQHTQPAQDPWGGHQPAGGYGGQQNPNDPPF